MITNMMNKISNKPRMPSKMYRMLVPSSSGGGAAVGGTVTGAAVAYNKSKQKRYLFLEQN